MAKLPSPSFPFHGKQGRRPCGTAVADLAVLDHGGGRGEREKGEEREELRFPYLARAMVE